MSYHTERTHEGSAREFTFEGTVTTPSSQISSESTPLHQHVETSWVSNRIVAEQGHHIYRAPAQSFNAVDSVGRILEAHDEEDMAFHKPFLPDPYGFNTSLSTHVSSSEGGIQPLFDDSSALSQLPFHEFAPPGHRSLAHDRDVTTHTSVYTINYPVDQQDTVQQLISTSPNAPGEYQGDVGLLRSNASTSNPHVSSRQVFHLRCAAPSLPDNLGVPLGGVSLYNVATQTHALHNKGVGEHDSLVISNATSVPGPSSLPPSGAHRLLPNASDKKRSVEDYGDLSDERIVFARRGRASSVHSNTPFDRQRRPSSSNSMDSSVVPGRGPRIPQVRYTVGGIYSFDRSEGQRDPITFNVEGSREVGVLITDILSGQLGRLENRMELVEAMGRSTVSLRFHWPGYPLWTKAVASKDWKKLRSPLTREGLAKTVAKAVQEFFKTHRDKSIDPDHAAWSVCPTSSGIQLSEVVLVALHHVSQGSWQPELCLSNLRP